MATTHTEPIAASTPPAHDTATAPPTEAAIEAQMEQTVETELEATVAAVAAHDTTSVWKHVARGLVAVCIFIGLRWCGCCAGIQLPS